MTTPTPLAAAYRSALEHGTALNALVPCGDRPRE
jgi:hypothetical protein